MRWRRAGVRSVSSSRAASAEVRKPYFGNIAFSSFSGCRIAHKQPVFTVRHWVCAHFWLVVVFLVARGSSALVIALDAAHHLL